MIKEEFIEVRVINSTVQHYNKLGYDCKIGDIIKINPNKDLTKYSNVKVTAICSNPECKSPEISILYSNYIKCISKDITDYYCFNCKSIKTFKKSELKQNKGNLQKTAYYYFHFKENRIAEFHKYIMKYKVIDRMSKTEKRLYQAILRYDKSVIEFAKELGYDINEISNSYVDNRGDCNKSKIECCVANILIENGLKENYQRNVIINEKYGNYDSDFVLKLDNQDKDICIEVWGYSSAYIRNSKILNSYNKQRKIKENIYELTKDTKILISLDYDDFDCSCEQMQINITNKLKPYLNMNFKVLDWDQVKWFKGYTEDDIMQELFKYSKDGMMPTQSDLCVDGNGRTLLYFISRNFKNAFKYFSDKMGLKMVQKKDFWNQEEVYNCLLHQLHTYNKILSHEELRKYAKKDYSLIGLECYMTKIGGAPLCKINFFKYFLENYYDIKYVEAIKNCLHSLLGGRSHHKFKQEAKDLLDKLTTMSFSI